MPLDLCTTNGANSLIQLTVVGDTPGSAHRAALPGSQPHTGGRPKPPIRGALAGLAAATPRRRTHMGTGMGALRDDGARRSLPPGTTIRVPPRDAACAGNPGEHQHRGFSSAGPWPPLEGGLYPPLSDSRRCQDLERNLKDAQATCHTLLSEQDRRLQELQRVQADLHRYEGDLSSMRRDHARVSGELLPQRASRRSLEDGRRLYSPCCRGRTTAGLGCPTPPSGCRAPAAPPWP